MESEAKLEQFLLLAKRAKGLALSKIIEKATSEPGVFTFGELLDLPSVKELRGSESGLWYNLLELFCYGTLPDYRAGPSRYPSLNEQQLMKLKQLTIMSMAENSKTIPYSELMAALEIDNVRALEDLLITDCFYAGILKGKLDQRQRALQVSQWAGRDVRAEQLQPIRDGLASWLGTSQRVLASLEEKMRWTQTSADAASKAQADLEARVEEVKKGIKTDSDRGPGDSMLLDDAAGGLEYMEEDRITLGIGGRPKRRR
ncbi:hypothetical protein WJX72_009146 [[Myrmecia] bisecta]|uniref:PCI domain-containing protein n=1 Tax=[Myrmecia] bisecta TaxID=41462 RepID=A0AAW1QFV3_9CHLO